VGAPGPDPIRALPMPIVTPRLELRWPSSRLNDQVVRLVNDPAVHRWTLRIPSPYARADAAEFVRRARANRRSGRSLSFQIVRRLDGTLLGGVGLHGLGNPNRTAEVGYWLGRQFRGLGFATEAVQAVTRASFDHLGIDRVDAHVFPGNARSERVLLRSGFRREGQLRESVVKDGKRKDEIVYARLRSDPEPVPPARPSPGRRGSVPRTR
jgi:[ribosomal protein S5]-alanine N-acetyltransferase